MACLPTGEGIGGGEQARAPGRVLSADTVWPRESIASTDERVMATLTASTDIKGPIRPLAGEGSGCQLALVPFKTGDPWCGREETADTPRRH